MLPPLIHHGTGLALRSRGAEYQAETSPGKAVQRVADDQQPTDPVPGPAVERIGSWLDGQPSGQDDDDEARQEGPGTPAVLRTVAADLWANVRSLRFWLVTVGPACALWVIALILVWLPGRGSDPSGWLPAPLLTFMVALVLLPAAAALVAVHWGMDCYRGRLRPDLPPGDQESAPGVAVPVLAAIMRSLVFVVLVLLGLLAQAAAAGQPAVLAAVSAGVAAAEAVVFGSMGVAAAVLVRNARAAKVLGWLLALFLVVGNVAMAALVAPALRSEESVTVAINVQRAPDGTLVAYECSPVPAGVQEVYRTEQIWWLAGSNPGVVFIMLAGGEDSGREVFGWLSAQLQEAADGSQVPCVNGEPRSREAVRMPVAAAGLVVVQACLAGALVASAAVASRRRNSRLVQSGQSG